MNAEPFISSTQLLGHYWDLHQSLQSLGSQCWQTFLNHSKVASLTPLNHLVTLMHSRVENVCRAILYFWWILAHFIAEYELIVGNKWDMLRNELVVPLLILQQNENVNSKKNPEKQKSKQSRRLTISTYRPVFWINVFILISFDCLRL